MIRMGCNPIKGILPFKVGEFAIMAYMKKKHNLSYPKGFFSLLFGYVFSFIVLILFYSLRRYLLLSQSVSENYFCRCSY